MKEEIKRLLLLTACPGIEKLIKWMELNGFFESPCSGGHHLAVVGGLAEHSLNVYYQTKTLWEQLPLAQADISLDSIILVSLLHDLGKCGQYGKAGYVPNMVKDGKSTKDQPEQRYKQSDSKPFVGNKELLSVPHEVRSVQIASQFIELTEEESFAIFYHNALYVPSGRDLNGHERPLQMLLHFSDLWCSRVIEVTEEDPVNE